MSEAVRTRCRDLPEKLQRSTSKREKQKLQREKRKQKKIEEIAYRLEGFRPTDDTLSDQIEEWVDEDFERMDIDDIDSEQFCDSLSGDYDIPIQKTGTRWYHHQYAVGRFFKSIREDNNEHDRTTILIIRGRDKSIYRLGIPEGEESSVLSSAISKGYILSQVKISHVDR